MRLIAAKNLSFAYKDKQIFKNLDFSYDSQDFLVITGPNGCGKSTLLKLLLGLIKTSSKIKLENIKKSEIGYVPQHSKLNDSFYLRVLDLVLMSLNKGYGFYSKKDKIKAFLALKRLKILKLWDKKLSSLSGGERQKAFIARAICAKARLLILDEPTSSVDAKAKQEIFDFLKSLHDKGTGIIMVSHDINTALKYTEKIIFLDERQSSLS